MKTIKSNLVLSIEQGVAILIWKKTKEYAQRVEATIESQLMTSKARAERLYRKYDDF